MIRRQSMVVCQTKIDLNFWNLQFILRQKTLSARTVYNCNKDYKKYTDSRDHKERYRHRTVVKHKFGSVMNQLAVWCQFACMNNSFQDESRGYLQIYDGCKLYCVCNALRKLTLRMYIPSSRPKLTIDMVVNSVRDNAK